MKHIWNWLHTDEKFRNMPHSDTRHLYRLPRRVVHWILVFRVKEKILVRRYKEIVPVQILKSKSRYSTAFPAIQTIFTDAGTLPPPANMFGTGRSPLELKTTQLVI